MAKRKLANAVGTGAVLFELGREWDSLVKSPSSFPTDRFAEIASKILECLPPGLRRGIEQAAREKVGLELKNREDDLKSREGNLQKHIEAKTDLSRKLDTKEEELRIREAAIKDKEDFMRIGEGVAALCRTAGKYWCAGYWGPKQ